MNKIEQLMQKHCPKGVEFRSLGEIGSFTRGNGLSKADLCAEGVGCIHYGEIHTFYHTATTFTKSFVSPQLATTLKKAKQGDLIIAVDSEDVEGVGKAIAYLGKENICIGGHAFAFSHKQNPRFLAYLFQTQRFLDFKKRHAYGTKITTLNIKDLQSFTIPIPPLEIQEEIVRILDTFSQLTTELTLRKKQYEYYRNLLLDFNEIDSKPYPKGIKALLQKHCPKGVEFKSLGEVTEIVKDKIDFSLLNTLNYVGVDNLLQNRMGKTNSNYVPQSGTAIKYMPKNILIGNIRPYLKKIWFADREGGTNGDVLTLQVTEPLLQEKFLFYILSSDLFFSYVMQKAKGTKMPRGDKIHIKNYQIPIPPLEIQQEIVAILDRFEALTNNYQQGLPAEIEAREKQYRYYRDQLLNFKEIS